MNKKLNWLLLAIFGIFLLGIFASASVDEIVRFLNADSPNNAVQIGNEDNFISFWVENNIVKINTTNRKLDIYGDVKFNDDVNISTLKLNKTGIYSFDKKAYARSYDVIICRDDGTKPELNVSCDVVCQDNDCSDEIESVSNNSIYFRSGNYPLINDISMFSNTMWIGDNNVVFNVSDTFSINTADGQILENVGFYNLKFQGNLPSNQHGFLFNFVGLDSGDNLVFENIEVKEWNQTFTFVTDLKINSNGVIKNIFYKNIRLIDTRGGIQAKEQSSEREDKIINFNVEGIHLENVDYYDEFYNFNGWGIEVNGGNTVLITNGYFVKSADGQNIVIRRNKNVNVNNIFTNKQHDYAIVIDDGSKNVDIKNVFVDYPRHWGAVLISNTNFITPTENIKISGVHCLNCGQGTGEPDIYINQNKAGALPMKNIEISNFFLDSSKAYGAISINAQYGDIENVIIKNGVIQNSNNAGIRFQGRNHTKNVVIENVRFIDNGINSVDSDKDSGILFDYPNVTNVVIRYNEFINNTAGAIARGIRFLGSTDKPNSYVSAVVENNFLSGNLPLYTRYNNRLDIYDETIVSGNKGIGTTSPDFKLDIAGAINASSYYTEAGAGFTGICNSSTILTVQDGIIISCRKVS
ncbi:hypothetical protein HYW99_00985 [Candidatus Woesearchaeota archaeon]|nr:hypothetical protein [Candidatus Woesearchaeota archaeon]